MISRLYVLSGRSTKEIYSRINVTPVKLRNVFKMFNILAAHCFYDENGALLDKNEFILAAGKYYRDLDKPEKGVQIRKASISYLTYCKK